MSPRELVAVVAGAVLTLNPADRVQLVATIAAKIWPSYLVEHDVGADYNLRLLEVYLKEAQFWRLSSDQNL